MVITRIPTRSSRARWALSLPPPPSMRFGQPCPICPRKRQWMPVYETPRSPQSHRVVSASPVREEHIEVPIRLNLHARRKLSDGLSFCRRRSPGRSRAPMYRHARNLSMPRDASQRHPSYVHLKKTPRVPMSARVFSLLCVWTARRRCRMPQRICAPSPRRGRCAPVTSRGDRRSARPDKRVIVIR